MFEFEYNNWHFLSSKNGYCIRDLTKENIIFTFDDVTSRRVYRGLPSDRQTHFICTTE